jgi:ferredoxin
VVADPLFLGYLAQFDDDAWRRVVDRLDAGIHPVDRLATRAWFHFFPLRLQLALDEADDAAVLAHYLRLQGRWRLEAHRETSHWFLFGHRYWPNVRAAVRARAATGSAPGSLDLAAIVQTIARDVAGREGVEVSRLVGITAVALRTLQQVGLPEADLPPTERGRLIGAPESDPDRIVAGRRRGSGGWLQFLKRGPEAWRVTFDERRPAQSFPLIDSQHLTTAAALDTRDYRQRDERCSEGPIPVQCRSCSCGTCWVGILDGAEHLSPVDAKERTTIAALGYLSTEDERPVIRLACMAQAHGPVTIVIPPWNGQIGIRLTRARAAGVE